MDDPQTDTISLTNLANCEGSCRGQGAGDMMLVADPAYHTQREWLVRGACQTLTFEQVDDLSTYPDSELHLGAWVVGRTSIVSLASPCQQTCKRSSLGSGPLATVISRINKRSIRLRSQADVVRAFQSRGKSLPSCRICCFCSAVTLRIAWHSKVASSASRSAIRCIASFQRFSSILAIRRLLGQPPHSDVLPTPPHIGHARYANATAWRP